METIDSVENFERAQKSKISFAESCDPFPFKDTRTKWEVLLRGKALSSNGNCVGWRDGESGYSWLSYSKFLERCQNFGSGLFHVGVKPGQSTYVGIYGKNSLEWLIAEFGCYSQSIIIVPLYDTLGPEACSYIINQVGIRTVICDEEDRARPLLRGKKHTPTLERIIARNFSEDTQQIALENDVQLHSFENIENLGQLNAVPLQLPKPTDVSIICYTSGTTGDPKGVILTHGNIVSATAAVNLHLGKYGFNQNDVMISYLPLAHIFEHIAEMTIFLVGGSIGFYSGDVSKLVEDMKLLKPTFFPAVPRVLSKLFEKAQSLIPANTETLNNKTATTSIYKPFFHALGGRVRVVLSGAAPITESVLNFFQDIGCQVMEVYGQTECGGPICLNVINGKVDGTVGSPVPCCMVKLIDVPEMGYYAAEGKGEVCVKGHNVFQGYFKNPKKTAETIDSDGWIFTGDIGVWQSNGKLKIVDRRRNIFKLAQGEFVAPEKIENVYMTSPFIAQMIVYGNQLKSFLVAVVVPEKEVVLSKINGKTVHKTWIEITQGTEIRDLILKDMQHLAKEAKLKSFEQVRHIYIHPEPLTVEAGHLTATSKIKREVCLKLFKDEIEKLYKNQS